MMQKLTDLLTKIDGRKTYIVGGLMVAYGVFQVLSGNVPVGVETILGGLGFVTTRHAIAKVA